MYNSDEDKPASCFSSLLLSFSLFNSFFLNFFFIHLSKHWCHSIFPKLFESSNRANTTMQSSEVLVITNLVWKPEKKIVVDTKISYYWTESCAQNKWNYLALVSEKKSVLEGCLFQLTTKLIRVPQFHGQVKMGIKRTGLLSRFKYKHKPIIYAIRKGIILHI